MQVYVDGVLSGSATSETGVKTTPFRSIGRIEDTGGTPTYLAGSLDDLRLYNRVLTAAEIEGSWVKLVALNGAKVAVKNGRLHAEHAVGPNRGRAFCRAAAAATCFRVRPIHAIRLDLCSGAFP